MNNRGAIPVVVLWVAGALAASQLVPNWRLPNLFAKGPPTKELIAAQEAALKAKAEALEAQNALKLAQEERTKQVNDLTQSGQQLVAGIPAALKDEPQTVGVKLATSLANRASDRLTAAIGGLPLNQQEEILRIVADAKSQDAKRIADAEKALADKDAESRLTVAAKLTLESRLPTLESNLKAKEEQLGAAQGAVAQKTTEVAKFADRAFQKEKEAGSLSALVGNLWKTVLIMAVIAVVAFIAYGYVKYQFGGIPLALGRGLSELRAKHPGAAQLVTGILDANFNRHEQQNVANHAK